jgi:hypothetical protein
MRVLHAHLLAGDDVEDRVARPDERFDFSLEIHEQPPPPGSGGAWQRCGAFLEPPRDARGHRGVIGVVTQQFLRSRKFKGGLLLSLLFGGMQLMLPG